MRTIEMRRAMRFTVATLLVALPGIACELDVTNPNNPTEEEVARTAEGLKAVAVGLQRYYASNVVQTAIVYHGVTAREVVVNSTYWNQEMLELGGTAMTGAPGEVVGSFSRPVIILRMSDLILENAPDVTMNPGTRSGLLALAHLYRAMALGELAKAFEQAPLELDMNEQAVFVPRMQVLAAAVEHLQQAEQTLSSQAASPEFTSSVLGSGFDMLNVIRLYRARFLLMSGQHQLAFAAANTVDPSSVSYFRYDATYPNPVFRAIVETRLYGARDGMGPPAMVEPGDKRLDFFLAPDDAVSNPNGHPMDKLTGFFTSGSAPIPVYRPGEITLIKAEAYLRAGELTSAVTEINKVRTKTAAQDPLGLGAGLPPYSGAVTPAAIELEIFRQRAAELYLAGTRWEDSRRLNRPGPPGNLEERNRNFFPYPDQERLNNPNTPADPAN
jgi:starch-binding outer membrane protein, SusD/RagB family